VMARFVDARVRTFLPILVERAVQRELEHSRWEAARTEGRACPQPGQAGDRPGNAAPASQGPSARPLPIQVFRRHGADHTSGAGGQDRVAFPTIAGPSLIDSRRSEPPGSLATSTRRE
jgi:hypothetical protein